MTEKTDVHGNQNLSGNSMTNVAQGAIVGQTALENGGKFLEQVLLLLTGKEDQSTGTQNTTNKSNNPNTTVLQENQSAQTSENIQSNTEQKVQGSVQNQIENLDSKTDSKAALQEQVDKTISQDTEQAFKQEGTGNNRTDIVSNGLLNQLKNEPLQTIPNKIISLIREGMKEGNLTLKDVKQLLLDSEIGRQLTTEQSLKFFTRNHFGQCLKMDCKNNGHFHRRTWCRRARWKNFIKNLLERAVSWHA